MENASKALIIAGAILISILLISVGIIIMNAINDPVSRAGDSAASQAIDIFNNQFSTFAGTQSATTIKTLVAKINASNGANPDHQVALYGNGNGLTTLAGVYGQRGNITVTPIYWAANGNAAQAQPQPQGSILVGQAPAAGRTEEGYICAIQLSF